MMVILKIDVVTVAWSKPVLVINRYTDSETTMA